MSGAWNLPVLIGAIIVVALTVLGWLLSVYVRRRSGRSPIADDAAGRAQRLQRLGSFAAVVFVLGVVYLFKRATRIDASVFNGGLDPWLRVVQLVGIAMVIGAVLATLGAFRMLASNASWKATLWSVPVAASCLALVWFAFAFGWMTLSSSY
jgi:hypothetical protein